MMNHRYQFTKSNGAIIAVIDHTLPRAIKQAGLTCASDFTYTRTPINNGAAVPITQVTDNLADRVDELEAENRRLKDALHESKRKMMSCYIENAQGEYAKGFNQGLAQSAFIVEEAF